MRSELINRLAGLVSLEHGANFAAALREIDAVIGLRMGSFWRYNSSTNTVSINCRLHYHADKNLIEEHIHPVGGSLIGHVLEQCQAKKWPFVRISDVGSLSIRNLHRRSSRIDELSLKELISIPIEKQADDGRVFISGILNLYCREDASLDDEEIIFIKNMISILDQKDLYRTKANLSSAMLTALQEAAMGSSAEALKTFITKVLPDELSVDACTLYEWSNRKHTFMIAATTGILSAPDPSKCFDYLGAGLAGSVAELNSIIAINNVNDTEEVAVKLKKFKTKDEVFLNSEVTTAPLRSVLLCPIHNPAAAPDEMPTGVIKFVNKKCRLSSFVDEFSPVDIDLAREVARLMAFYEDRQRLERGKVAFALQFGHEAQAPAVGIKGSAERLIMHQNTSTLSPVQKLSILENIKTFSDIIISFSDSVTYGFVDKRISFRDRYRFRKQNLRTVLERSKRIVIPYCRLEGLQFDEIRIIGSYPEMYLDERAFSQVFYNLFTNAIKYRDRTEDFFRIVVNCTSAARNMTLRGKNGEPDKVVVIRGIHVDVQDYGIGIDHEYRRRIFSEGYRIPSVSSLEVRGSGIGLSIVKNIVEDFGGFVTVSRLKNPTTFRIFLPSDLENAEYINKRSVENRMGEFS